jgi:hypothetical protein
MVAAAATPVRRYLIHSLLELAEPRPSAGAVRSYVNDTGAVRISSP